jgi:hypothetical protein
MRQNFAGILLPAAFIFIGLSCTKESRREAPPADGETVITQAHMSKKAGKGQTLLQEVKSATARFHSTGQAQAAGYQPTTHCVPNMGYHWVNPGLVDGSFNPMEPEVLLYEKKPNGQWQLVAVEYIVLKQGQDKPMFDGHPFDNAAAPGFPDNWSLHVWLHKTNPNGVFAAFNPDVHCDGGAH